MALREENDTAVPQDTAERSLGRPRRTIVDIRPFSGKEDDDISEWLIRWEIAATANNWTSDQQLTMIPAYLTGRAARVFWRIPEEVRNNLDDLKDHLDETFNTEEKRYLARQKLQEVTQGPKESVAEFSERVDKLVIKGHDGLDGLERRDRIACESFIKGLRADIKETVWEKCPASFQEAIQAAERREVFLNSLGRRSRVNEVSEDLVGLIQKFNEERMKSTDEIWKAIQDLTTAVQGLAAQQLQATHTPPLQPTSTKPESRGTALTCFHCRQSGHMKRNCPKRHQRVNLTTTRDIQQPMNNQATNTPSF